MYYLEYLLGDQFVFMAVHLGFFAFVCIAILREQKMRRDIVSVKRGKESLNYFPIAYGILSVIIIQMLCLSEFGKGYKIVIAIFDLVTLLYMTFFNSWFRNKIIDFFVAHQNKAE
jgi:hypothetical protein